MPNLRNPVYVTWTSGDAYPTTNCQFFSGLLCFALVLGCATYQVGTRSLYRPDIQTVHVQIFASNSYRRFLGERLTEAVVKEIELKTPYKVVCAAEADSRLSGYIVTESKRVLAEDINDAPRDVELDLTVQIRWETRQGDLLRQPVALPLLPDLRLSQAANLIPEGGQSIATAHQHAISKLAEEIVAQMEYPW